MLRSLAYRHELPTDWKKLVQLVHVKAGELGLHTDHRRDLQVQLTGKASCRDMTVPELQTVYRRLRLLSEEAGLGKRHGSTRSPSRRGRDERLPDELPTKEQCDMIEHLYEDLHIKRSPKIVIALCKRITGHSWPQSRREANMVIEALKQMRERGWRATQGVEG